MRGRTRAWSWEGRKEENRKECRGQDRIRVIIGWRTGGRTEKEPRHWPGDEME